MSYPVVAECWSIFESALMIQAKKLVEDIAKKQKADPKVLWAKVRPTVKISLLDVDMPEESLCSCSVEKDNSPIYQRCRAPCLLGFNRCPMHITTSNTDDGKFLPVKRYIDYDRVPYFVDELSLARDSSGIIRGIVEDNVLYLFDKS